MKRIGLSRGLHQQLIIDEEEEETSLSGEFICLREYVIYTILVN